MADVRGPQTRSVPAAKSTASSVAARCTALLRGGVAPRRVFAVLASEAEQGGEVHQIHERVSAGVDVAAAIAECSGDEWSVLASAWRLSEEAGAPLAPTLARMAAALRALEQLRERRRVLVSGPQATVRLVASLPPVALGLGWLIGFDPLPLLITPLGFCLVFLGVALLGGGIFWARSLVRGLRLADRVAGLECDLAWIVLGGGAAPGEAIRRVVDCVADLGARWVPFDAFCSGGALQTAVRRAAVLGMPLRPLLLEEADSLRDRTHSEMEAAAEQLGVRVLLPLGVCVLPSFIVMGVMPVVISMLGQNPGF
ncbi:hypothetical protein G7067_00670 [Leucobacter insecticola]|uniref:Type II secretion system protein GspF domain-containing protein n=1 Tax=Leucobacter insecticola TaxID=2714934 RepID=A0A6G8FLL4_9MICO|nr:hypothetical protein G7067_00670 [Leucobacter insecticola]